MSLIFEVWTWTKIYTYLSTHNHCVLKRQRHSSNSFTARNVQQFNKTQPTWLSCFLLMKGPDQANIIASMYYRATTANSAAYEDISICVVINSVSPIVFCRSIMLVIHESWSAIWTGHVIEIMFYGSRY